MAVNLPRAEGRRPARAEATTPRKATTEGILDGHLADEGADDLEDDISVIGDFAHGRQEQPLLRCWQLITIVILFTSPRKPRLRPRLISTSQNSFPAERMTRQPAGSIKNVDAIVVRADRPTTLDEAHPGGRADVHHLSAPIWRQPGSPCRRSGRGRRGRMSSSWLCSFRVCVCASKKSEKRNDVALPF